jgi:hypothetical protein
MNRGMHLCRSPIDSRSPDRSPAARAGLIICLVAAPRPCSLTAGGDPPRRALSRRYKKKPSTLLVKVLGSGDVLLSHGLSPYYHRGCSVSLPCSEWERVGPLRCCHQRSEPDWHLNRTGGSTAFAATSADANLWRRRVIEVNRPYLNFSKNMLDRWHLHTGFRKTIRLR